MPYSIVSHSSGKGMVLGIIGTLLCVFMLGIAIEAEESQETSIQDNITIQQKSFVTSPLPGVALYPNAKVYFSISFDISGFSLSSYALQQISCTMSEGQETCEVLDPELQVSMLPFTLTGTSRNQNELECGSMKRMLYANTEVHMSLSCSSVSSEVSYFTLPPLKLQLGTGEVQTLQSANLYKQFPVKEQESLSTPLLVVASQHPNRILNGRTTQSGSVENREDGKDVSNTIVNFLFQRTPFEGKILGEMPNNYTYTQNTSFPGAHSFYSASKQGMCLYSGVQTVECLEPKQNGASCQTIIKYPMSPDALRNSPTPVYQWVFNTSAQGTWRQLTEVSSFNNLPRQSVVFTVTATLPSSYPKLLSFSGNSTITYPYTLPPDKFHSLIANNGLDSLPKDVFASIAKEVGRNGMVLVGLTGEIHASKWQLVSRGDKEVGLCVSSYVSCSRNGPCNVYYRNTPMYAEHLLWERRHEEVIPIDINTNTTIDVFSSAAWIQTKGGNFGTNNDIILNNQDSFSQQLKYAGGEVIFSYDGKTTQVDKTSTVPLMFSPLNEHHADFMIYGKFNQNVPNSIIRGFSSKQGWYHDEPSSQDQKKFGYNLLGDEYDRTTLPRNYDDDMFDREVFGDTVNLMELCSSFPCLESQKIGNISRMGQTLVLRGNLTFEKGKIYTLPQGTTLYIGAPREDVTISGGPVRIHHAQGTIRIRSNIYYALTTAKQMSSINTLRIYAKNVLIDGDGVDLEAVRHIEALIEAEFVNTGESHDPLFILGDLIVSRGDFKRKPAIGFGFENVGNNPPSEMIIEDYRKYLAPPPGDTVLRDRFRRFDQINPYTGEVINPHE